MDRKNFLKASGVGVGLTLIPGLLQSCTLIADDKPVAMLSPKIMRNGEGDVLNVIGDIQTHVLVGSDTDNQIVEWVDNVVPGTGIPPHVHTKEDEIFRVITGEIELMVGDTKTVLKSGDTAFAPKGIPHAWTVVGTEKAKMITTAFPAGIELMFQELAALPEGPPDFAQVAEICGRHGIEFLK